MLSEREEPDEGLVEYQYSSGRDTAVDIDTVSETTEPETDGCQEDVGSLVRK